jgi:hypothetical protein
MRLSKPRPASVILPEDIYLTADADTSDPRRSKPIPIQNTFEEQSSADGGSYRQVISFGGTPASEPYRPANLELRRRH